MAKKKKKIATSGKHGGKISKLGARIKALRIKQGYMSAEKFALDHELSRVQMGRWEQGKNIRIETVFKLADAFGITSSELFKDI
jgi:transcriptional regulator with XRE-family HTH domain